MEGRLHGRCFGPGPSLLCVEYWKAPPGFRTRKPSRHDLGAVVVVDGIDAVEAEGHERERTIVEPAEIAGVGHQHLGAGEAASAHVDHLWRVIDRDVVATQRAKQGQRPAGPTPMSRIG